MPIEKPYATLLAIPLGQKFYHIGLFKTQKTVPCMQCDGEGYVLTQSGAEKECCFCGGYKTMTVRDKSEWRVMRFDNGEQAIYRLTRVEVSATSASVYHFSTYDADGAMQVRDALSVQDCTMFYLGEEPRYLLNEFFLSVGEAEAECKRRNQTSKAEGGEINVIL